MERKLSTRYLAIDFIAPEANLRGWALHMSHQYERPLLLRAANRSGTDRAHIKLYYPRLSPTVES